MMDGTGAKKVERSEFIQRLLTWFSLNGRHFPWRETDDPYRVLVAELMLQRTGANQVKRVYETFVGKYPTVKTAAQAAPSELQEILRPLGLAKRVGMMMETFTRIACEWEGAVPDDVEALTRMPGVGPYTARAVACFAYGRDVGLLDANVARTLARAFGLRPERGRPHTRRELWAFVDSMVPAGRGREFNRAMIDLGATVCVRANPRCGLCPVVEVCRRASSEREEA